MPGIKPRTVEQLSHLNDSNPLRQGPLYSPFLCAWLYIRYFTYFSLFSANHSIVAFPCGSAGKESACSVGDLGLILSWEDPLEKGMATQSSILAWRIPWTL